MLLVSDYDGTFATSKNDIKINCILLKRFIEEGNYFVLSSGRPLDSLLEKVREYNIPHTHLGTSDGNYLFDRERKLIHKTTIPSDIVTRLDELKECRIYDYIQYSYEKSNEREFRTDEELGSLSFVISKDKITDEFIRIFEKLKRENEEYQFVYYSYDKYYFVVKPKKVSKSTPIAYLEGSLHMSRQEIYTIGDNDNDFEMIRD